MATFKIEYKYYVGDLVEFKLKGRIHRGIVQDISQVPDVFVETVEDCTYKRYRLDIDSLELIYSEHDDAGTWSSVNIEKGENIEMVHGGELGTKEFGDIIYTRKE